MNNSKVVELNIEYNNPTADSAIQNMKNFLATHKRKRTKAVIVIHGYGSTGTGGAIKASVKSCLTSNSMRGIVRAFVGGEDWMDQKRSVLNICSSLKEYESRITGNSGVTVVILR